MHKFLVLRLAALRCHRERSLLMMNCSRVTLDGVEARPDADASSACTHATASHRLN